MNILGCSIWIITIIIAAIINAEFIPQKFQYSFGITVGMVEAIEMFYVCGVIK